LRIVTPAAASDASARRYRIALAAILGLAFVIRAAFVLGADFPLNDGGMFFQMTRDLQANGYALPEFTSYNGGEIPFTYPPLGFYVAAALDDLTPLALVDVFRVLPLVASCAIACAFLILARTMLPSRLHVITALVAFVTLPAAFQWMLMGGGITRAPGFVFALLAIALVNRTFERRSLTDAMLAGALGGLAMLSHLEMGLVVAYSSALFILAKGRTPEGVRLAFVMLIAGAVIVAPWAAVVTARHGLTPYLAAAQSGNSNVFAPIMSLLRYQATIEPFFQLTGALSLVGACWLLARRQFLLPAWLVATAVFDSRVFPTSASFIVAMMAAYAVVDVLLPLLRGIRSAAADASSADVTRSAPRWLAPTAVCLGVAYMLLSAVATSPRLLTGVTIDERAGMDWVEENTPEASTFAVVSGDRWPIDRTSEWFPALAGRRSVATVQGAEWLPNGAFRAAISDYDALQVCADRDGECLQEWADSTARSFDYVYIPKLPTRYAGPGEERCCLTLERFLRQDAAYRLAFDGPGAVIFERR
ncbi:MAG: hypothetical protein WD359_02150, partial [Dehalococcoidia bacterium]